MYRYELTDGQWEQSASFFPDRYHHGGAGPPCKEHRPIVNGILWHLHTGAPWPDLPERYGPWKTAYRPLQSLAQGRHLGQDPGRPAVTAR